MTLLDLTAIDRLIDLYGDDQLVRFLENNNVYSLEEFRLLCEDNNWNFSIDEFKVSVSDFPLSQEEPILALVKND
jgi:hypothetical protein